MSITREGVVIVPSMAEASAEELAALPENTAREQEWYKDHRVFADYPAIAAAVAIGELVEIEGDDNLTLTGRMRNPDWHDQFPPYLLPHAAVTMKVVAKLWRQELEAEGKVLPRHSLSFASAVRDEDRTGLITEDPTKLAIWNTTHKRGGAGDFDASGYYWKNDAGVYVPIIDPERKEQPTYHAANQVLREHASPDHSYETPTADVPYEPEIMDALLVVADRLYESGLINRVIEYSVKNTYNRCLHVAASPEPDAIEHMQSLL